MTNQADGSDQWKTSARGESAWKEDRERVADRNAEARKSGKQEREAYERERDSVHRTAAAKRHAQSKKVRLP